MSPDRSRGLGRDGSILVLDDGVRAVSAAGGFRVPLALVILVLDGFRVAGDFLLLGGRLGGRERLGVGRERFRKYAVDFIGPAAVVLDDLVGDIRHGTPFGFAGGLILSRRKIRRDTNSSADLQAVAYQCAAVVGPAPAVISALAPALLYLSHPTLAARVSDFAFRATWVQRRRHRSLGRTRPRSGHPMPDPTFSCLGRLARLRHWGRYSAAFRTCYFARGSGRSWKCTAIGFMPLPPSISHGVRSPLLVHSPRPFQPALGSSLRPSSPLA